MCVGERTERLLGIREQMLSQRPQTKVHFEMASYMETRLLEQLLDLVIPHSDSLGMNEQVLIKPIVMESQDCLVVFWHATSNHDKSPSSVLCLALIVCLV